MSLLAQNLPFPIDFARGPYHRAAQSINLHKAELDIMGYSSLAFVHFFSSTTYRTRLSNKKEKL